MVGGSISLVPGWQTSPRLYDQSDAGHEGARRGTVPPIIPTFTRAVAALRSNTSLSNQKVSATIDSIYQRVFNIGQILNHTLRAAETTSSRRSEIERSVGVSRQCSNWNLMQNICCQCGPSAQLSLQTRLGSVGPSGHTLMWETIARTLAPTCAIYYSQWRYLCALKEQCQCQIF
ncbi:hypothetical protein EVAR_22441_1 [Eumeta japonica]|uniref:Uncharacterized protein n=1 Tax=Eumeta variegata TaxID=151549 RepID=A0A4C2A128_EUMVA|nr:hypothetical protein EVAR_22441_1 [Eumeta japonica]